MTRSAVLLALMTVATGCGSETGGQAAQDTLPPRAADELAAYRPDDPSEAAVVATVQRLFDALESGDEILLRRVVDASVVMHFSETRDG
ncbi:MAG: hypothetical protein HKO53_00315, partial [Gemmatimonadetes bacterium]|nr:hypothetical protein [Gemmatimonadota bacterium]